MMEYEFRADTNNISSYNNQFSSICSNIMNIQYKANYTPSPSSSLGGASIIETIYNKIREELTKVNNQAFALEKNCKQYVSELKDLEVLLCMGKSQFANLPEIENVENIHFGKEWNSQYVGVDFTTYNIDNTNEIVNNSKKEIYTILSTDSNATVIEKLVLNGETEPKILEMLEEFISAGVTSSVVKEIIDDLNKEIEVLKENNNSNNLDDIKTLESITLYLTKTYQELSTNDEECSKWISENTNDLINSKNLSTKIAEIESKLKTANLSVSQQNVENRKLNYLRTLNDMLSSNQNVFDDINASAQEYSMTIIKQVYNVKDAEELISMCESNLEVITKNLMDSSFSDTDSVVQLVYFQTLGNEFNKNKEVIEKNSKTYKQLESYIANLESTINGRGIPTSVVEQNKKLLEEAQEKLDNLKKNFNNKFFDGSLIELKTVKKQFTVSQKELKKEDIEHNIKHYESIINGSGIPSNVIEKNKELLAEEQKKLDTFIIIETYQKVYNELSNMNSSDIIDNVDKLIQREKNITNYSSSDEEKSNSLLRLQVLEAIGIKYAETMNNVPVENQISIDELKQSYQKSTNDFVNNINKTAEQVQKEQQAEWDKNYRKSLNSFENFLYDAYDNAKTIASGVSETVTSAYDELYYAGGKYYDVMHETSTKMKNGDINLLEGLSEIYVKNKKISDATAAQVGITLVSGLSKGAEGVLDCAATAATGIASIGTSVVDLATDNFGRKNSCTNKLYDNLDKFVSKEWVDDAVDMIYDTDFGKSLDENSLFKHDSATTNVVSGIGEAVFTIAAGTAAAETLGMANGSAVATKMGMSGAAPSISTVTTAVAGVKGLGYGIETALNDGADINKAVGYGVLNGTWESVQWGIGMGINKYTSTALNNSTSILKNIGVYTLSTAADTVDSAAEGFVQPLLKKSYSDKSYAQLFEENGGWKTVGTQATIGGIMSAVGTASDFTRSSVNIVKNSADAFGKVSGNQDYLVSATKAVVGMPEFVSSLPYKFMETKLTNDSFLSTKAMDEGLFHFTSLDNAQKIVQSGEIYASKGGLPLWYDTNKAYMFAGVPEYSQIAINMESVPSTVMTAVKIKPTDVQLNDLNFRYMDDLAVSHKGNFKFDSSQAEIVYFGVTKDADGNLKYREITKDMADNYDDILAKEGIKTKTIGLGNKKTTIVDGTNIFDSINKQLDVTKTSILKTLTAVDEISNKIITKVQNSKINVIDSIYNKFKDVDSVINNIDGNKVNISDKLKNSVKTVGGVLSATVGFGGILSGNPIFAISGGIAFAKGVETGYNGILGNYVKDSNFAIQRHKLTPAIDANIESGKYYAKGNLTSNSIVTDRISQSTFGNDVFLTGRLDSNQTRVFGLPLVNMLQQLKIFDTNSNQIIYSCESQSQTLMFLKKLAKEGYIEDLKYCESKSSAQNLEKFLMGANVTNKNHQLYEINFKLSPNKVFDVLAAKKMAETLKFDANLYNSKIKTIDGKDVVIFTANIPKLIENQVNAKSSTSVIKGIDVDSKLSIPDSANLK